MNYVFLHLPKCAGTTVHNFLLANAPSVHFCPERFNGIHDMTVDELAGYNVFSAHMDFAATQKIPGEKFLITTLREPKSRVKSLYKFWRSHDLKHAFLNDLNGPLAAKSLTFREFLEYEGKGIRGNIRNGMVRQFIGRTWSDDAGNLAKGEDQAVEIALQNLHTFDAVGFQDNLDDVLYKLASQFGVDSYEKAEVANKTNFHDDDQDFDGAEVDELLEYLTTADRAFYKRAIDMFATKPEPPRAIR